MYEDTETCKLFSCWKKIYMLYVICYIWAILMHNMFYTIIFCFGMVIWQYFERPIYAMVSDNCR